MRIIDNEVIKFNIMLSKATTAPVETMDPMTDPLVELSKSGDTDKYTQNFLSSIYMGIAAIFIAGVAITGICALIKVLVEPVGTGKGRNEAKTELTYKFFLVVGFFAAVPLFGVLVAALMALNK